MIEAVSKDRWLEAQAAEAKVVTYDINGAYRSTRRTFDYLGMEFDQQGKVIIEVGSGPFPAALFCGLFGSSVVIFEPLFERPVNCSEKVDWKQSAFETFDGPLSADEVWLFNVLQHVIDPERVIAKAKEVVPVVRFFEPVDYPTCVYHPHTFSQADFERWFPNSVKRYTDRVPGFFDGDCVYGTWTR